MNIINNYLQMAKTQQASDLHLVSGDVPLIRRDGQLMRLSQEPVVEEAALLQSVQETLSKEQWQEFVTNRDYDLSYEIPEGRFRLNCHWQKGTIGVTGRVVVDQIPTMDEIGLPPIVHSMLQAHQGLILLTGATGNGKSTNMAAMINMINEERSAHIITLEDPIEFMHASKKSLVRQREVGRDINSFSDALRHVLRQDPDVIMVGEMRDLETMATTITLAETGHLVMATLHTFSAPQSIDRIIDSFSAYQQSQIRLQLSLTLVGIVSQRLIPKKEGGRVAAREILVNNSAVSNCIRDNKIHMIRSILQTGAQEGMITMDQHIRELYQSGMITQETAQAYMSFPEEL